MEAIPLLFSLRKEARVTSAAPALAFLGLLLWPMLPPEGDLASLVDESAHLEKKGIERSAPALVRFLEGGGAAGVEKWIADLGNDDFTTREKASRELRSIGRPALPALKKAKASRDPEVAARAAELADAIEESSQGEALTRICAVRMLGRLKAKEALPLLKRLAGEGPDPFLRAHAARAITAIEGTPAPKPAEAMKESELRDLIARLPASTQVVVSIPLARDKDARSLQAVAAEALSLDSVLAVCPNRDAALSKWREEWKDADDGVERAFSEVGNFRVDGAVLGASFEVMTGNAFAVLLVRGTFDRERIGAYLAGKFGAKAVEDGGTKTFEWKDPASGQGGVLSFLDDRTILVGGGMTGMGMAGGGADASVRGVIVRKPGAEDGILSIPRMAERIRKAPLGSGGWVAVEIPDFLKSIWTSQPGMAWLEGLRAFTLSFAGEEGESLRLEAEYDSDGHAKAAADTVRQKIKDARGAGGIAELPVPAAALASKALASIQVRSEKKRASAEAPKSLMGALLTLGILQSSGALAPAPPP